MNLTKRFIALFLAALMCLSLFSCGKDEPVTDNGDPDDFTGTISPEDDNNKTDGEDTVDEGDETKTYEIRTADDLKNMKRKGTYVLKNDIDLADVEWTPVGTYTAPFVGVFDGNGYTLKNLSVTYDKQDTGDTIGFFYSYCGLFGVTNGATIKNVKFENAKIESSTTFEYRVVYAGVIAGALIDSEVTDCQISGSVTAKSLRFVSAAGSVAGYTKKTAVTNCVSSADVTVQESSNRAEAGGLIGNTAVGTVITGCSSEGAVTAYSDVGIAYSGGLIGYASATKINKSFSSSAVTAEITSSAPSEGKVGAAYAGGLIGIVTAASADTRSEISYSYAINGKINAVGNENIAFAGGLAAKSVIASFKNCYTMSDVAAQTNLEIVYLGGALGEIMNGTTVVGCFSKNNVSATAADNTNIYLGSFSGYVPEPNEENPASYITSSIYYTGASYTINGSDAGDRLVKNALGRQLAIFSSIDSLTFDLKWDKAEWNFVDGIPYPV
ncbi:MAG: hypothetical protein IJV70_06855 [Clostridia bacterium]|nr:hypothetical protein [Clostridia bacterium]